MQETKQRDPAEVAREEKLQKERETIAFEHDYFARPGGKTEPTGPCDDETDSAEEGEKDQVRYIESNVAKCTFMALTLFGRTTTFRPWSVDL